MRGQNKVTQLDILRHGETAGGDIFRGSTDVVLNTAGWQQMHRAVEDLSGWQHVVSSPMRRCLDFSLALAQQHAISHNTNAQLREISFGDWDGKAFTDVQQDYGALFDNFWRDPLHNTPPNAESLEQFCARVRQGFWHEIEQHQGKHLLMVVHGGVVRAILSDILHSPLAALMRFDVPYACLTRIKIYHETDQCWPQMVFHNRQGHLPAD